MSDAFDAWWFDLSAGVQDLLVLAAWLAPTAFAFAVVLTRYRVVSPVRALLVRHRGIGAIAIALIALSVGLGVALLAQERGLRDGSARAADPFDLLVVAPGSDVTAMLASVYLQSATVPLLSPDVHADLVARPDVALAAPLAFGDSVDGAPLVGTTAAFVAHLIASTSTSTLTSTSSEGAGAGADTSVTSETGAARDPNASPVAPPAMAEGRLFANVSEAVVGAATGLAVGDVVHPAHGHGMAADPDAHADIDLRIVGRLAPTGTPWDRAVVAPLETVWIAHGLGDGHAADERDRIGPPYDPARMPGVPVIVVRADSFAASYALRSAFTGDDRMAFFPGEVLARLHALLGDVRRVLSAMAVATCALVVAAVAALLAVLLGGSARRFAMLRALGAPRGFVFAVAWCYGAALVVAGAVLGIGVGRLAAAALSRVLSEASAVRVRPDAALADLSLVAAFALVGVALAAVPAWLVSGRRVLADLRS